MLKSLAPYGSPYVLIRLSGGDRRGDGMTVNSGFAGQPFIPGTYRRIERLAVMIEEQGLNTKIAIDGASSPEVVQKLGSRIEYFVLGTAGLFLKDSTYTQAMQTLRALCELRTRSRGGLIS